MESISNKALSGVLWFFAAQSGQRVVRFGVTIILARLLLPEDFGLVAMLEIFTLLAQAFVISGFGSALVQKKDVSQADYCTLFWYNMGMSLLVYASLFMGAPYIADFYGQSVLSDLLKVSALGLILIGFNLVQSVRFQRKMDFRTPVLVGFIALLVSATVGIVCAFSGFGVWSLVYMALFRKFFVAAIMWFLSDWRPSFRFSRTTLAYISSFGGSMLGVTLLRRLVENLPALLIGRFYTAATLGFYNRGRAVKEIATQSVSAPLLHVLFPTFSRIQDDIPRLGSAYVRVMGVVAFVLIPVLFCVAALAEPLVLLVYGEKWSASIPYFYWLALFGPLVPLTTVASTVVKSVGKTGRFLQLNLISQGLVVVALLLTCSHGILPMIWGIGIAQILALPVLAIYLSRYLSLSLSAQLRGLFAPFVLAITAHMICVMTLQALPIAMPLLLQITLLGTFFCVFYGSIAIVFKWKALLNLINITEAIWMRHPLSSKFAGLVVRWMNGKSVTI